MFQGMFNKIIQDLIAKGLQVAGTAIAGTGLATGEQTTALTGGLAAIVGIVWNIYVNHATRKDVAVVATANDEKKTTTQVLTQDKVIRPVGHDK